MSDEGTNAFRIEVEDDLIAAALAAVERLERHQPAAETPEIDVSAAAESPAPADEVPAFDAGPWGEPPPSAVLEANQRADAAEQALSALRTEAEDLREKLRRAVAQGRALRERTENLQMRLQDAEATSGEREKALNELRAAAHAQEVERVRQRQRHARELEDTRRFGIDALVREFLPALDNLDLALMHGHGEGEISADGLRMIISQLQRTLEKVGVERIEGARGAAFDPALHEAIQFVFDAELSPGRIAEMHQAGYRLNGRLLRAARVAVVRPPAKPASDAAEDEAPSTEAGPEDTVE